MTTRWIASTAHSTGAIAGCMATVRSALDLLRLASPPLACIPAGLVLLLASGCGEEQSTQGGLPDLRPGRSWSVPEEIATISQALLQVQVGDTIILACGVYEEHDLLIPNGIVLTSVTGQPDCVTVDAGGEGRVLAFLNGANAQTEVRGLTLTGGDASFGGGIWCDESSPRITDCVIMENRVDGETRGGGGVCCYHSSPILTRCVIRDNLAMRGGGGLYCEKSSPQLVECTLLDNISAQGGGVLCLNDSRPVFRNCSFVGNISDPLGGGAAHSSASRPSFDSCLFRGNQSPTEGGALLCAEESFCLVDTCTFDSNVALIQGGAISISASSCSLRVSTLVGNGAGFGGALYLEGASYPVIEQTIVAFGIGGGAVACEGDSAVVRCTDIFGNQGGDWTGCLERQVGVRNNISVDPLFCDPEGGDYRLQTESPCLGDSADCLIMGAWTAGCE